MKPKSRSELSTLPATLTEAAAQVAALVKTLEQREAEVAAAMEAITMDRRVAAAIEEGKQIERQRTLLLIELQREHLPPTSGSRMVLGTLRRMVENETDA